MRLLKNLVDAYIVFKMNLLALRTALVPYVAISLAIPIGFTYIISLASTQWSREAELNYIIGALTLSLALSTVNGVAQSIAQDKHLGRLRLFSSLPMSPSAYVAGVTLTHLLSGLVSAAAILLVGGYLWRILGDVLKLFPQILALMLASCIALVGLGAVIGTRSRDLTQAYMYSNAASIAIAVLTPAYYPPTLLPPLLRLASLALPTTHAACLVRYLLEPSTPTPLTPLQHTIALATLIAVYTAIGFAGIKWVED